MTSLAPYIVGGVVSGITSACLNAKKNPKVGGFVCPFCKFLVEDKEGWTKHQRICKMLQKKNPMEIDWQTAQEVRDLLGEDHACVLSGLAPGLPEG